MQPSSGQMEEWRLEDALVALSAREQVGLLLQATRSLSRRERVEVWRIAGFSVLRDRFLPLLLHVVLKRVLTGALLWAASGILLVALLLVLAVVEQIDANAVGPVLVGMISFLLGFLLFGLYDFVRSLIFVFRATSTRQQREVLIRRLDAYDAAGKMALLRLVSASLAGKIPGESLLQSLVSACVLLVVAAMLLVLIVAISGIVPGVGNFPWLLLLIGVAFLLGWMVPRMVGRRFEHRSV